MSQKKGVCMLYDTVDRPSVERLVKEFYAVVLEDELVGPYFVRALGPDINGGKWYGHLTTLKNFWLAMMNGEKNYWGDPFPAHAFIGQLYPETFERWLLLFRQTVDALFIPEIADKFYKKSETLAQRFIEYLGVDEDDD